MANGMNVYFTSDQAQMVLSKLKDYPEGVEDAIETLEQSILKSKGNLKR
jgi:hypothetical protein